MSVVRVSQSPTAAKPTAPPRKADGTRYRFELIDPDGRWRAYSDGAEPLLAELVSGYATAEPERRRQVRQDLAVQAQVLSQAGLLLRLGTDGLTAEEQAILGGHRETQPQVDIWSAAVPLLLVEDFYQPSGVLPRPRTEGPGEIIWIDARDEEGLLRSLHRLGWLVLAEADPEPPS
jgi:hypothetical protein